MILSQVLQLELNMRKGSLADRHIPSTAQTDIETHNRTSEK